MSRCIDKLSAVWVLWTVWTLWALVILLRDAEPWAKRRASASYTPSALSIPWRNSNSNSNSNSNRNRKRNNNSNSNSYIRSQLSSLSSVNSMDFLNSLSCLFSLWTLWALWAALILLSDAEHWASLRASASYTPSAPSIPWTSRILSAVCFLSKLSGLSELSSFW